MRVAKAQFRKLTRKQTIRRRLTPPQFAPVAATFAFPVWTLTLPLVVVSEANQREFWAKKYRRKVAQQAEVDTAWRLNFSGTPATPAVITLTRLGGRRLDSDNLAGAFKHIRDQIARILGVDDGSDLLTWWYAQEPGGPRGIRIEIEEEMR